MSDNFNKLINEEFYKFFTKNRFLNDAQVLKEDSYQEKDVGVANIKFPDFDKIMPVIKITEAWGKLGNTDRGVIEKFPAALGGKDNTVHDPL